jgi:uncharacterized protein (TIGR00297 family)
MLLDALLGAALSLPVAIVAARFGRVTPGGALAGVGVGAISYAAFALAGLAVLGTGLLLALGASQVRRRHDRRRERSGDDRRGAHNIIANCFVGCAGAAWYLAAGGPLAASGLWFTAAIAAGASDTVASELGQAFGGQPRMLVSRREVAPGTPGGVTMMGIAANAAAAAVIALPAAVLWLISYPAIIVVAAACVVGSLVESVLAAHLEERGVLGNDALNVITTATGAAFALWWID